MLGKFISVEGGDGAGKSTNIAFIQALLEALGSSVLTTREPGGTALGEKIRALLLDPAHHGIANSTELLLMFAARAEHIDKVIQPALQQGIWVVCDRFTDATYAYQGGGRDESFERIEVLEQWVQGDLKPDLTLLLDLPVEVSLQRTKQRQATDRFEQEQQDFFEKVRAAYLKLADLEPGRVRIVDAAQSIKSVQATIKTIITEVFT